MREGEGVFKTLFIFFNIFLNDNWVFGLNGSNQIRLTRLASEGAGPHDRLKNYGMSIIYL